MRESKVYQSIAPLGGHELNRLHRFVVSPYFNRNQAIIHLFEWIKEDLKVQESVSHSKFEIWSTCYPKEDFDDGRFRKLQSDLLHLVEEFYAQEIFEKNPIIKAKYLLEAIYNKNLLELQTGIIKTARRLVAEQTLKASSYYYYQYEIEQSIFNLNIIQTERRIKFNIEEIAENLDRFYLGEKLRYYCAIVNHQHLVDVNYKMLFIDEIIEHVESNDYSDTPPIIIYHQILLSFKEPNERRHYDSLKKLIELHIHLFPENEVSEILASALNYCLKRVNAGESEFVKEFFEICRDWLQRGLLQVRGKIDPFHYKNMVTASLRLNEFEWVEEFIHNYSWQLDERFRENAVTFNLAQLYFYRKEYSKVINQLSQVEYDDITYNLNSKTLLMASYYELDELEALGSLLDTFRVYLSRNKEIPITRRSHYLNTIRIVKKLSKIQPGDAQEIGKLKKEVENTQGVVSKNWILEKLSLLELKTNN